MRSFHAGENAKAALPSVLFLTRQLGLIDALLFAHVEGGSARSRLAFPLLSLGSLPSQSSSARTDVFACYRNFQVTYIKEQCTDMVLNQAVVLCLLVQV